MCGLNPTDADVLVSHRTQASAVEQVFGVEDERTLQELFDAIKIQGTKFGPPGADHQGVGAFGGGIRGITIVDRSIQLQRAALLRILEGDPSPTPLKVQPRTSLIRAGLDEGKTYFLHEEEVRRAGVVVAQRYRRTRWRDGRAWVWIGVRKQKFVFRKSVNGKPECRASIWRRFFGHSN